VVERGYVLIHLMYPHIFAGEFDTAYELAEQIVGYGHRYHDPDLIAMGLCSQGRLLLYGGRVPDGLALLDESMVGVAAGEVSTIFAGNIYCAILPFLRPDVAFRRRERPISNTVPRQNLTRENPTTKGEEFGLSSEASPAANSAGFETS
jgi:hypothetical protein